jgi:hypothetical protein
MKSHRSKSIAIDQPTPPAGYYQLLTEAEACKIVRLAPDALRALRQNREIDFVRFPSALGKERSIVQTGSIRYRLSALHQFIDRHDRRHDRAGSSK